MLEGIECSFDPQRLVGTELGGCNIKEIIDETSKRSVIYSGVDKRLNREVAVKVLRTTNGRLINRFVDEGKKLAKLEHPGIVRVYSAGESPIPFMVMEKISGLRLEELVKVGNISSEQVFNLISDLTQAVKYCHGQGINHGDIKPTNVIIREDGRPVLIDFGGTTNETHLSNDAIALSRLGRSLLKDGRGLAKILDEGIREYSTIDDLIKSLNGHSRRKMVGRVLVPLGLSALGLVSYAGIRELNSASHTAGQIRGMDFEDPRCGERIGELKKRLYNGKILWLADKIIPEDKFPFATFNSGEREKWLNHSQVDYSNGFWPGILWEGYRVTGNKDLLRHAERWTDKISLSHFDAGQINAVRFFYSHAKAYDVTGVEEYRSKALEALDLLISTQPSHCLISPSARDSSTEAVSALGVISFLDWAARVSGSSKYSEIASINMDSIRRNHIREDGSVRKTAVLDADLKVAGERNSKGFSSTSTLARSQAYVLSGLMNYLESHPEQGVLDDACRVGDFFISNTPPNGISYIDFGAPRVSTPRDSSASAIALEGLRKLGEKTQIKRYYHHYLRMRHSLVSCINPRDHEEPILGESCESLNPLQYPKSSTIYGSYFFLCS